MTTLGTKLPTSNLVMTRSIRYNQIHSDNDHVTIELDDIEPPSGVFFIESNDSWSIDASTRSWHALVWVPFAVLWNSMVWFGFYGQQIMHDNFSLVASLLGLPFVLLGLFPISGVLLSVCGHTVVKVEGNDGQIFLGVGRFGWTRKFDWSSVQQVSEYYSLSSSNNSYNRVSISLAGEQTRIQFGSLIGDERRAYVIDLLTNLLARRKTVSPRDQ
jgi:hypothetical protein